MLFNQQLYSWRHVNAQPLQMEPETPLRTHLTQWHRGIFRPSQTTVSAACPHTAPSFAGDADGLVGAKRREGRRLLEISDVCD